MMPVVWKIPYIDWAIPGYGLMMMIGFLTAIIWAARRAQRSGADPDVILNCGFIALIAGVVGCRVMYVVHYWENYARHGDWLKIAWAIIDVSKGGLEFYGGFITAVVCVVFYLWRWGYSLRWYLDIMAPSSALGLAFGRVGCLLNGCCFGAPCDLPWAIQFPYGSNASLAQWAAKEPGADLPKELLYFFGEMAQPVTRESLAASDAQIAAAQEAENRAEAEYLRVKSELEAATDAARQEQLTRTRKRAEQEWLIAEAKLADVRQPMRRYGKTAAELRALAAAHQTLPVHPAQVYNTILAATLAFLLNAVYWRRRRDGQVILTLLLVEPMSRWMLELIRADNPVDTLGAFTISQFLAICMTAIAVVGFFALRFLPRRSPKAKLWTPPEDRKQAAARDAVATR